MTGLLLLLIAGGFWIAWWWMYSPSPGRVQVWAWWAARPGFGDAYKATGVTPAQCGMAGASWWMYSVAAAVLGVRGPGERVTGKLYEHSEERNAALQAEIVELQRMRGHRVEHEV